MKTWTDNLRNSPLSQGLLSGLGWWLHELADAYSQLTRKLPSRSLSSKTVIYAGHHAQAPDDLENTAGFSILDGTGEGWAQLADEISRSNGKLKSVSLQIADHLCLIRTANYPDIPAKELKSIIDLEIVSATPFDATNAAWSWRRRKTGNGPARVETLIVKTDLLDAIISQVENAGVILEDIRPQPAYFQPAPAFRTFDTPWSRARKIWRKVNIALCTALLVWGAFLYGASYLEKASALATLEAALQQKTKLANSLRADINQKEEANAAALRISALKNDRTSIVETWARATTLLPKNAWLSELKLDENGGSLVGFTDNAASLIGLLENHPALENVRFETTVRIDPITKLERFDIRFDHEADQ